MEETQTKDKFKAVWVSHSSIADFLKCPRLYYLRNVYKDPRTGHKMTIMTPPLALGQVVHEVIEGLSVLPSETRLSVSLTKKMDVVWEKVSGDKGGFRDKAQEDEYRKRGGEMLSRIEKDPGPILRKAVKIKADGGLPYYWLSEEDNIILCGKIDWIEYLEVTDAIHIIDFKTGKNEEVESSLQLPIYVLLAKNLQGRTIEKASYWYLTRDNGLVEKKLPDSNEAYDTVYKIASRISLSRKLQLFKCETNGCRHCFPFERILKGEGKFVGLSEYKQDLYVL